MANRREENFRKVLAFSIVTGCFVLLLGVFYRTVADVGRRVGRDFYYPYLSIYSAIGNGLSDLTLLQYSKMELAERVQYLQNQNRILTATGNAESQLASENAELRQLLDLPRLPEWEYVPAQVMLRDPLYYFEHFTLNKGTADGVKSGDAVFTVSNLLKPILVGVINKVTSHTSDVLTVQSRRLQLSALLPSCGVVGLINPMASSAPDGVLVVGFLPSGNVYQIGEEVLTSGLEPDIPAGLKLGNLISMERPSSIFDARLYLAGTLRPAADLNRIKFVMIAHRKSLDTVQE